VQIAFSRDSLLQYLKNIFQLKPEVFVFFRKSRKGWTMPLHTKTSPRQLYSHARSHINGSHLRLPRLLTIPPHCGSIATPVAASVLNRSAMIPFAVFYLYLTIHRVEPRPCYYLLSIRQTSPEFSADWASRSRFTKKSRIGFYNHILRFCNYTLLYITIFTVIVYTKRT